MFVIEPFLRYKFLNFLSSIFKCFLFVSTSTQTMEQEKILHATNAAKLLNLSTLNHTVRADK